MDRILLTGFTPFDGRDVNGSWVAAQSYPALGHLEIPVIWGKPLPCLSDKVSELKPDTIISMGEGKPGGFTVECLARNTRKQRPDNLNQEPAGKIMPDGPEVRHASINAAELLTALQAQDIPIHRSEDAGQYLCEETLYSLEHLKSQHDFIYKVVFVHLPPFGTEVTYRGEPSQVDELLLKDFVARLVPAVIAL